MFHVEQSLRSAPSGRNSEQGLAPRSKYSRRNAEEYFGHRKNGILRQEVGIFCEARPEKVPRGTKHKRPPHGGPLCSFRGMCLLAKLMASFYITVGADANHTGAAQKNYFAEPSAFLKAFAFGTRTV